MQMWLGWFATTFMIALSGSFLVLRHAPLQRELERVEQQRAVELKEHGAAIDRLRADLELKNRAIEALQLKAAGVNSQNVDAVAKRTPVAETPAEKRERTRSQQAARVERTDTDRDQAASAADDHRAKNRRGVDLAAEAAATAALEAQVYGEPPATPSTSKSAASHAEAKAAKPDVSETKPAQSEPKAQPSPNTAKHPSDSESKDGLTGVLDEGSDPLQGL